MFDIIIPTYKPPIPLLKKCLESIQNQSFEDYVVWVCDGTPHNWMRYDDMQRVMEEYPEFNFVRQIGKGVSQARNQIISQGSNPFIAFLDADDYWREDYLYNMYYEGIMKNHDEGINIWFSEIVEQLVEVHEGYLENVGKQGKVGIKIEKERIIQRYDVLNFIPFDYQLYFHVNSALWFSATIFTRKLIEEVPFKEDLFIGEDTHLTLECIKKGAKTQFLPFIGAHRNIHSAQATQRLATEPEWVAEQLKDLLDLQSQLTQDLIEDDSGRLTDYQKNILLVYLLGGKKRGYSFEGGSQSIYLISEEELELEEVR